MNMGFRFMRIIHDLRKNWSDWVLGAAAVGATINWFLQALKATGTRSTFILATATLGLLVLLIIDRIFERRTLVMTLLRSVRSLRYQLTKRGHLLLTREDIERMSLRDRVLRTPHNRKHIIAYDYTLFGLVVRFEALFKECIENGIHVQFMIANPELVTVPQLNNRWFDGDDSYFRTAHSTSEKALDRLITHANQVGKGSIEVKYLAQLPYHGLFAIDPNEPHGEIQIQMRIYGLPSDRLPVFLLTNNEEPELAMRFYSEWEALWKNGQERRLP